MNETVLIVEDDSIISMRLQDTLENWGFRVVCANTAEAALQLLQEIQADLILMDVRLEGELDGIQAAEQILNQSGPPTVFLTAYSDEELLERAKLTEPYGYLVKPVHERELISAVKMALYKHQLDQRLRESEERYRSLARYLQTVREDERTRVAHEIHDEFGQSLTAIKMELLAVNGNAKPGSPLAEKLADIIALTDIAIDMVRRVASELRPGLLDDLGLDAALEWQASEFTEHTQIPCSFECQLHEAVLDRETSTALFRIFQEALTNVARHSGASQVRASLINDLESAQWLLTISDNGRGIPPEKMTARNSMGLLGMRERARALGGELWINGSPGEGTTVQARIPNSRNTNGDDHEVRPNST